MDEEKFKITRAARRGTWIWIFCEGLEPIRIRQSDLEEKNIKPGKVVLRPSEYHVVFTPEPRVMPGPVGCIALTFEEMEEEKRKFLEENFPKRRTRRRRS